MDKKYLSRFEEEYLSGKEYTHSLSEAISFAYDCIVKDNTIENYRRLINIILYASEILHSRGDVLKSLQLTTLAYGFLCPKEYSYGHNVKEDMWVAIFANSNPDIDAKTLQAKVATCLLQNFISYISAKETDEKISNIIIEDLISYLVHLDNSGKVDKNASFYPLMAKYVALSANVDTNIPSFLRKDCYYTLVNNICGIFDLEKYTLYILLPSKRIGKIACDIALCPFEYKDRWGFMHNESKHILIPPQFYRVASPKYWKTGTCLVKSGDWYEFTKDGDLHRGFRWPNELLYYPGTGLFRCNPWLKSKEYYSEDGAKIICDDYIYADYGYIVKENCYNKKISLHSTVDMSEVSPKDIDIFKEYIDLRRKEFIALIPYAIIAGGAIILAFKSQYSIVNLWESLGGWTKLSYICAILAFVAAIIFVPKIILSKQGNRVYEDREAIYMGLMSLVTIIESWSAYGLYYLGYQNVGFVGITCWILLIASILFQFIITCTQRLKFRSYRYGISSGISFFVITQMISLILFAIIDII